MSQPLGYSTSTPLVQRASETLCCFGVKIETKQNNVLANVRSFSDTLTDQLLPCKSGEAVLADVGDDLHHLKSIGGSVEHLQNHLPAINC